ncbi:hypothetical protein SNE40_008868 [Patella caerulea]|uniref:Uncharacterized protein n=1 Tax=Patella caerulea TaxID=87958 RepID=A0AAN8JTU9_PATCE
MEYLIRKSGRINLAVKPQEKLTKKCYDEIPPSCIPLPPTTWIPPFEARCKVPAHTIINQLPNPAELSTINHNDFDLLLFELDTIPSQLEEQ